MQTVKDVMTTNVECVTPLDNVYEVAVKMKELNVGAIPVVNHNKVIGMITDRDLVIRGYAEKRPGSTAITKVLSDGLVTCTPETTVADASKLMAENQIRRLPVVNQGELVGIVSLGDLATNKMSDESAGAALSEISENEQYHH